MPFIAEAFFVLRDEESIPNITILHDIIIGTQSMMSKDRPAKLTCTRQEVLRKIHCETRDAGAFQDIFGSEQAVAWREQMDIELAIDEPGNVMQNMR